MCICTCVICRELKLQVVGLGIHDINLGPDETELMLTETELHSVQQREINRLREDLNQSEMEREELQIQVSFMCTHACMHTLHMHTPCTHMHIQNMHVHQHTRRPQIYSSYFSRLNPRNICSKNEDSQVMIFMPYVPDWTRKCC